MLDEVTAATLRLARPLFLVTTLALPVLRNTKRFLELLADLEYTRDSINIIVNRYNAKHETISLRDFEDTVQQQAFWLIPNDYYATANAIYQGEPISAIAGRAKIAKSFKQLAASLTLEAKPQTSLWSKFLSLGRR